MGYKFGTSSLEKLHTCEPMLIELANEAIKRSQIDFGIAEGYRTPERQKLLYDAGKSKIDGINRRGKHNYNPSKAFDIFAYVNGRASWDERYLAYIGGVITSVASIMEIPIRWGGNWDSDGVIITDQSFIDLPHFELN